MHLLVHGDAVGKKVFHRYQDVIADVVIIKETNTTFGGTASKASGATHVQLLRRFAYRILPFMKKSSVVEITLC